MISSAGPALEAVRLDFDPPLVPGRLVRRFKRFLAEVDLDSGQRVLAHCPNSGSMLGCLEDGAPVYLSPSPAPGRRTAYTWEMIHIAGGWVGINTGLPNRLVALAAERRALPCFSDATSVRREVKISAHTRLDLLVQRASGPLYVEVKNVTLVQERRALFPDAVTSRGAKHLTELMALTAAGQQAAMVYLVQRGDADSFAPARDIDPTYARLLAQALAAGVGAWVAQARVTPQGVVLRRLLPLEI
ncbi:MAG: DNA/RNA nuclease SfsA [Desulfarculus sp.]|nr:DNA/RNA nuclease SfsA [Desulfarculus sp.]